MKEVDGLTNLRSSEGKQKTINLFCEVLCAFLDLNDCFVLLNAETVMLLLLLMMIFKMTDVQTETDLPQTQNRTQNGVCVI